MGSGFVLTFSEKYSVILKKCAVFFKKSRYIFGKM